MASGELSRRVEKVVATRRLWTWSIISAGSSTRRGSRPLHYPFRAWATREVVSCQSARRGAGETRATHSSASRTGAPTGASWPPRGRTSGARTRGSGEAAQSTPSAVAPGTLSAAWPRWVATRRSLRRRRWDCVASKRLARRLGFRPGGVLEVLMHERNGHAASSSRTARAWRRSGSTRPATTRSPARCSATCSCAAACTPSPTPRRSRS